MVLYKNVNGERIAMTAEEEAEFEASRTPTFEQERQRLLNDLAEKRWQVETGGMMFGGNPVPTDRQTAAIVTAAYVKASADSGYTISNFKASPGVFVSLDAATIIAYGDALEAHVQAAFNNEAALTALILAAGDVDDLAAIDIEGGW